MKYYQTQTQEDYLEKDEFMCEILKNKLNEVE